MANVSYEGRQLLKEMLRIDPAKRPYASELLKRSWFKTFRVENPIDPPIILDCMRYFTCHSPDQKFQQAALAYMVHHLTDIQDIKEIRKLFDFFDTNCDGKLSHQEVFDGFKNSSTLIQTDKEFMKTIKKVDCQKNGFIEYEGIFY
jgi:Ca2+-binding EF-hand superfamily protein